MTKYQSLCKALLSANYRYMTVKDYIASTELNDYIVVLRHDVDRSVLDAFNMARLESDLGIKATYYFRSASNVFNPKIMKRIADMEHEVGFHYESLAQTHGNYNKAIKLFTSDLRKFQAVSDVSTISMHGRPLSKWDSRLMWDQFDFKEFGILGEAYLSINYKNIKYFCDTGRSWHSSRFNIRDKVDSNNGNEIQSTDELIDVINNKQFKHICISCHPNRWPARHSGWMASFIADWAVNGVKMGLKILRNPK